MDARHGFSNRTVSLPQIHAKAYFEAVITFYTRFGPAFNAR